MGRGVLNPGIRPVGTGESSRKCAARSTNNFGADQRAVGRGRKERRSGSAVVTHVGRPHRNLRIALFDRRRWSPGRGIAADRRVDPGGGGRSASGVLRPRPNKSSVGGVVTRRSANEYGTAQQALVPARRMPRSATSKLNRGGKRPADVIRCAAST